jgi:transcriptional antiterminator RfaH
MLKIQPYQMVEGPRAPSAPSRWYAVNCLSNRESLAAAQLRNQGFRIFLPCRLKTRRHARKFDSVLRPLFPGYLFVQLDLTRDRWRSINGTVGVVRIVGHSEAPSPAPVGAVEALQSACDELDVMQSRDEFAPGDAVRVACGPFAELIGQLEQLDSSGRVRVLLELMGRRACVALPRDYVVSAQSAA